MNIITKDDLLKNINNCTQADFLKLPFNGMGKDRIYHSMVIVNAKQVHDSGFGVMALIGCRLHKGGRGGNGLVAVEIAAYCDHIWLSKYNPPSINIDMLNKSKCTRYFLDGWNIKIGISLSSTQIEFIKKAQ